MRTELAIVIIIANALSGTLPGDELASIEQRRDYVQQLSDAKKVELARKLARFQAMTPDDQQRLRKLDAEISNDPNSEQLRQVLSRYADWLATLPATRRSELADMDTAKRIEEIKKSFQDWAASSTELSLKPSDIEKFRSWFDAFLKKNEAPITEALKGVRSFGDPKQFPEEQHRRIRYFHYLRQQGPRSIRPSEEEINQLISQLSREAQELFQEAKDPGKRQELIQQWFRLAWFPRPTVSKEDLQRFYEEGLRPQDRDILESLPTDQVREELTKMYFRNRFGGWPRGRGGPGGPPGREGVSGRDGPGGRDGPYEDRRGPFFQGNRELKTDGPIRSK